MTATPPAQITPQLAEVCVVLERHLGDNLRAIHLYGSALEGGLKPLSDIDLMATIDVPLCETSRHALMQALLVHSAWPGSSAVLRALELTVVALSELRPWRYPPKREMQFGEWLRNDIEAGRFASAMVDPDLAILMTKLRLHSTPLHGPEAVCLFEAVPAADFVSALTDTIAQWKAQSDWNGDEKNVLLALARIWFSAATGKIATKDAAAAWVSERLPPEHAALMMIAADAYLSGQEDGLAMLPDRVEATIRFCKREIEGELSKSA
ncbi:aminoglycoside adenylyltransferase family protein [Pseudomonas sp. Irchel 3F5]|uniref:aminoglycoside adenylyltransferase family protein n=1 Tax=Pseudomonas sp. Irchel 3F5 TaxID=2009002 RepID=UPI000BA45E39|nr:aminoglycoside adenylyltransferase family protein [Pseudomonas sp. Irchel 3F5]